MKNAQLSVGDPPTLTERDLHVLEHETFRYFWSETNPRNGLIADHTLGDVPASIAGVGMALAAYPVGVERRFVSRRAAADRALTTLRFFHQSKHGRDADATGYRGLYYHFLDVSTGRRAWRSELSTIDTAILLAGALTCAAYFVGSNPAERDIRALAKMLYERADWQWARNGGATVTHGWTPERGFQRHRWQGYNEALLLYVLGLGSETHPLPKASYATWTKTYVWKNLYGHEFLFGGPLFMHQLSHVWIDFRAIQDDFMRRQSIDYFENSRRATYVQQQYAIRNPKRFVGYDALRRLSATLTQERFIGPEWLFEGKLDGIYRGITEAVADKGYHSNQVMVDLEAVGVRSYISEPDRGQRNWKDNSEARGAVRSPCQTPCGT